MTKILALLGMMALTGGFLVGCYLIGNGVGSLIDMAFFRKKR